MPFTPSAADPARNALSMCMPHVAVAMNAREHFTFGFDGKQLVHEVTVAVQTCLLSHSPIARLDPDGLMEVSQCKCEGMEEAVVGLHDPFTNRMMRQMAVVADSDMLMAGVLPRVVVALHHMTIDASCGIVA